MKLTELEQSFIQATNIVPGNVLYRWYTTYGVAPEIVEMAVEKYGYKIDWNGYNYLIGNHSLVSGKGTLKKKKKTVLNV
jgi:alanyl-tRNA synthetase